MTAAPFRSRATSAGSGRFTQARRSALGEERRPVELHGGAGGGEVGVGEAGFEARSGLDDDGESGRDELFDGVGGQGDAPLVGAHLLRNGYLHAGRDDTELHSAAYVSPDDANVSLHGVPAHPILSRGERVGRPHER